MKTLYALSGLLLGIGLVVLVLYFSKFHSGLASEQETWAQFGELMGGVLSPLISLITIFAVYKTIRLTKFQINSSHFYELIRLHNERRNELSYTDNIDNYKGASAFKKYLEILKNIHREICLQCFKNRVNQYMNGLMEQEYQLLFGYYNRTPTIQYSMQATIAILSSWNSTELEERANEALVNATNTQRLDIVALEYLLIKQNKNDLDHWSVVYDKFYEVHGNEIGIYFRNLYNILESIERMFDDETESLSKLFRAQISRSEIALLYFNLLGKYSSSEFYRMVDRFKLLKGLYLDDVCKFGSYQVIDPGEHIGILKRKYDG